MKQLDAYSVMIVSKYFVNTNDFFNITMVCSKFNSLMQRFHYNPIPLNQKMKKYFPRIQTQFIYSLDENIVKGIKRVVFDCKVDYSMYLKIKTELPNDIASKFLRIEYSMYDCDDYGFEIPPEVNLLGYCTFSGRKDHIITLPESIKIIAPRCLYECSMDSLIIPTSIRSLPVSLCYCCTNLTNIQLPNTIGSIQSFCFYGCCSLKSVIIPTSVSVIGGSCFEKCHNLETIEIPDSVEVLSERLFKECFSLTSIHLPSSLSRIRNGCFFRCSSLGSIQFHSSNKTILFPVPLHIKGLFESNGYVVQNVKYTKYDRLLNENYIPEGVSSIEKYCFAGLPSLTSVQIPSTVTKIGKACFSDSDYIETMSIPPTIRVMGKNCLSFKISTMYSFF